MSGGAADCTRYTRLSELRYATFAVRSPDQAIAAAVNDRQFEPACR